MQRRIPLKHNESYWLLTDEIKDAYSSFGSDAWSRYPDYTELKSAVAAYAGVNPTQVCITAGSDAFIEILFEMLAEEGKRVLLPVPTFYGYERIAARTSLAWEPVCYREEHGVFAFPREETLRAMRNKNTDALFLCQPNNPLGTLIPQDVFEEVLTVARETNTLVVSDEAYFEFAGVTALPHLSKMSLSIVRTFSKGFGLSGARVGYAVLDEAFAKRVQERLLPWPVAHPSVFAVLRALAMKDVLQERVQKVIEVRESFCTALREISGLTAYPSVTNFVLVRVPDVSRTLQEMDVRGIDISPTNHMSSVPEAQRLLSGTVRLSVPSPEDTPRVLEAFRASVQ